MDRPNNFKRGETGSSSILIKWIVPILGWLSVFSAAPLVTVILQPFAFVGSYYHTGGFFIVICIVFSITASFLCWRIAKRHSKFINELDQRSETPLTKLFKYLFFIFIILSILSVILGNF